ncbi:hypothetical protein FOMPIDRAFT_1019134 [Fomitopsis schrenkii]|uniref:Uncharacterized protein n=1 Tax=Fomitopsis schrenkii TaxID=2126942 RepID=S8F2A0_FOMSC|nr:hypothetical protein FOMPIDRAFT_1019134 [Fomitopsis schrenkii]
MESRRQTREANKAKHPGEVQIIADLEAAAEDPQARQKRRSAVEVAAAKKAQDDAQKVLVSTQRAAIQKVAKLQHQKKLADQSDMTSPVNLPPKFRTRGLAAVDPKPVSVNPQTRWVPVAMESDDEEEADIEDADLDVDHTNADEAGVQTTAISERQPHATAGTAAIYTAKKASKKGKKKLNKVHRADIENVTAAFEASSPTSEPLMPRTVLSEAMLKRDSGKMSSAKRKSSDTTTVEKSGSSSADAPALKKQKPYTPSRGGVLPGWVQARSSAVDKVREAHVKKLTHINNTAAASAVPAASSSTKEEDIDPVLRAEVPPPTASNTSQGSRNTAQLLEVVGRLPNPWDLQNVNLSAVFQQIWDDVFPDNTVPQPFVPGSGPYRLCMQKIYDWRSSFGSNAIKAVRRIWDQEKVKTTRERARLADTAIGAGSPYLYGRVVFGPDGDVLKHSMRFQSTVILSALAGHFQAIEPHPMAGNPQGALLLCTTAAERAWTIATAGTFDMKCLAFTEKLWSASVPLYLRAIQGLPDHSWFNINTVAMEIKKHSFAAAEVIEIEDDDEEVIYSDAETEVDSDDSMEVCAAVIKEVTRPRPIF